MIELDLTYLPHIKSVAFINDVIHMYEDDKRHPHSVFVSSVEWAQEVIEIRKATIEKNKPIVEAGGYPAEYQAANAIKSAEKDLLYWTHIALPCAIDFEKRMAEDEEIEVLSKEERKKLLGKQNSKLIVGPDSTIGSLFLAPGDRFIDNYHYIKYVFQRHYRWYREYERFDRNEYKAVNEATGKEVTILDHDSYQKLTGKGKVIPTPITLEKIAIACGMEYWQYHDYLLTTVERYMRINKLLDTTEEDVKKVIELIKSVS